MKKAKSIKDKSAIWLAKDDAVSAIVVAAVLVVIAVILALIFKDYIMDLLSTVFTGVNDKVNAELGTT